MRADEVAKAAREELLARAPEHIRQLGGILRESIAEDTLEPLTKFLEEHGIEVPEDKIDTFRDVLIVGRVDLADIAPDARERLRARTLLSQPLSAMTLDYRAAALSGQSLHCRDCKFFVTPPNDDGPHADKACVAFGTKGADEACFGFLWK